MKLSKLLFVLFLLLIVSAIPSQAQEPLTLYDNFNAKFLDATKWFGRDSIGSGMTILEIVREIDRTVVLGRLQKRLRLALRTYGADIGGGSAAYTRLHFAQPENIRAIQATLEVQGVDATGCDGDPTPTQARARIYGYFFNLGESMPDSGLNDVYAQINVRRRSTSTDPSGVMEVVGNVTRCDDAECNSTFSLGDVTLGTTGLRKKVKLRIAWDPDNDRFIFQKGLDPERYIDYTVSDAFPSYIGNKRLEILQQIPNCATLPRPTAHMDVLFDNVLSISQRSHSGCLQIQDDPNARGIKPSSKGSIFSI